ncbi:MAG TPA: aspartate aminotransferase family protein, partial [Planctomycetaceae bacterium]|nr:aspartate aminotransferase family protein [Planctomycetaceae bacterium]
VLIFDEVMTGFRVAFGCAQTLFGITPDMTALGKIIGGGMPVGAYGGRADIMAKVSPDGPVYQAGTLSGNPVAMAAGLSTLQLLRDENPYPHLELMGEKLAAGLGAAAQAAGLPHQVARVGSMLTLFFNDQEVKNYSISSQNDTARFAKYFHGMLNCGIYLPCSQYEAMFISNAHTEEDLDKTIQAAHEVMKEIN